MNNFGFSSINNSSRWLWGLVIVLGLLNAALVTWLWLAPVAKPQPEPATTGATFLPDTLGFSASQRVRYDTLRAQYVQQLQVLAESCPSQGRRYATLLDSTLPDNRLAASCRAALDSRVTADMLTVRHLQQVAAVCTPAQRVMLHQLLLHVPASCGATQPVTTPKPSSESSRLH